MNTKERMKKLNISQVEMILMLRERGITVSPPEMSATLSGLLVTPKAKKVLTECENIMNEDE